MKKKQELLKRIITEEDVGRKLLSLKGGVKVKVNTITPDDVGKVFHINPRRITL